MFECMRSGKLLRILSVESLRNVWYTNYVGKNDKLVLLIQSLGLYYYKKQR